MLTEDVIEDMLLELTDNGVELEFDDSRIKNSDFEIMLTSSNNFNVLDLVKLVHRFSDEYNYDAKVLNSSGEELDYGDDNYDMVIVLFYLLYDGWKQQCIGQIKNGSRCKRQSSGKYCHLHKRK